MKTFIRSTLMLLVVALTLGACTARNEPVADNGPYFLEIVNPLPVAADVSYNLGAGTVTALGRVEANDTERFTIRGTYDDEISVVATSPDDRILMRELLELREGEVVRLVLEDERD